MDSLTIQASNIKCAGCASNIETGLTALGGVRSVEVNIETNQVTIEGDKLDRAGLESKLAELGYPAL